MNGRCKTQNIVSQIFQEVMNRGMHCLNCNDYMMLQKVYSLIQLYKSMHSRRLGGPKVS